MESGRQTQAKRPRMVHSKSHSRIWDLIAGRFHLGFLMRALVHCRHPLLCRSLRLNLVATILSSSPLIVFPSTGQCGMEIAILLLLTLSLTAATPLRSTPRSVEAHQ